MDTTDLYGEGVRDYHDDHRYVKGHERAEDEKCSIVDHANPRIRHNVLGIGQTCENIKQRRLVVCVP